MAAETPHDGWWATHPGLTPISRDLGPLNPHLESKWAMEINDLIARWVPARPNSELD